MVETETGVEKVDRVRTSSGMFLERGQVRRCMHSFVCWPRVSVGWLCKKATFSRRRTPGLGRADAWTASAHMRVHLHGPPLLQDPIIADIEKRIAKFSLMPVGNGEGLQVLVRVGSMSELGGVNFCQLH